VECRAASLRLWTVAQTAAFSLSSGRCRSRQIQGNTAAGRATQYVYEPGMDARIVGEPELAQVEIHLDAIFATTALPLVGREDFFTAFRVEFDQLATTFTLTTY
jgi:hypothetical protein